MLNFRSKLRDAKLRPGKAKPWLPEDLPIWNDRTKALLDKLGFTGDAGSGGEKIGNLLQIGKEVAELNSWELDEELSDINTGRGVGAKIRWVFRSVNGRQTWFLSIDVENTKGTFEVNRRDGKHYGQIAFQDGHYIPRAGDEKGKDPSGDHNLKLVWGGKKRRAKHS